MKQGRGVPCPVGWVRAKLRITAQLVGLETVAAGGTDSFAAAALCERIGADGRDAEYRGRSVRGGVGAAILGGGGGYSGGVWRRTFVDPSYWQHVDSRNERQTGDRYYADGGGYRASG